MARSGSSQRNGRVAPQDRLLLGSACLLLVVAFISGGSSQQSNLGAVTAQLLALPVLLLALVQAHQCGVLKRVRWSLAAFALVIAIPLLQLSLVPESWWMSVPARQLLRHDLVAAGVTEPVFRWSLSPGATERSALLMLPGAALFVAALALGAEAHRRLFWAVVTLAFFSLVLGILQIGAGQNSALNLYPQWVPAMGGVFANPNHQAACVAIALVLSIALLFDARSAVRRLRYRSPPCCCSSVSTPPSIGQRVRKSISFDRR